MSSDPAAPDALQTARTRVAVLLQEVVASAVLVNNRAAATVGITHNEMQSLRLLQIHGMMTPSQLAALTGLSSGAMTTLLDRLEHSGLVRREPHPTDRRKTLVFANDEQIHTRLDHHDSEQAERFSRLVATYTEQELATIARFLEGLAQAEPTATQPPQQSGTVRRDAAER